MTSERLRRHLRLIDEGVAPVVTRYAEHIQCRAGCSDCCRQTFVVSELEGAWLREGLDAAPPDERADIVARARAWQPDAELPCPVLGDDGRCRLYAHRPRICHKYGIPLWHPDRPHEVRTCPKNFRGVADLEPDLVLVPQARWAEDWIAVMDEVGEPARRRGSIARWLLGT
jgi:uncharacterized protein